MEGMKRRLGGPKPCLVGECNNEAYSKGMCEEHAEELKQTHGHIRDCLGCGRRTRTVFIFAAGGNWHPACFCCDTCQKKLSQRNHVVVKGKPSCKKCSGKGPSTLKPTSSHGTKMTALERAKERQRARQEAKQRELEAAAKALRLADGASDEEEEKEETENPNMCPGCGRETRTVFVFSCGRKYHPGCLTCSGCDVPVKQAHVVVSLNKPYCPECGEKLGERAKKVQQRKKAPVKDRTEAISGGGFFDMPDSDSDDWV